jgi:hypothetical protein
MTPRITRGRLTGCVGVLAIVMAAGVVAEAWPGRANRSAPAGPHAAALPVVLSSAPDAPPIDDWMNDALGRPLFAADRRPDAAVAAPEEALPRLSGTIRLAETSLAMFQPAAVDGNTKSIVLGEGAQLSGWTITDIASDGVTLVRDGRIATLRLSYANLPAAPHRLGQVPTRVLHDKRTSPFLQP